MSAVQPFNQRLRHPGVIFHSTWHVTPFIRIIQLFRGLTLREVRLIDSEFFIQQVFADNPNCVDQFELLLFRHVEIVEVLTIRREIGNHGRKPRIDARRAKLRADAK